MTPRLEHDILTVTDLNMLESSGTIPLTWTHSSINTLLQSFREIVENFNETLAQYEARVSNDYC